MSGQNTTDKECKKKTVLFQGVVINVSVAGRSI